MFSRVRTFLYKRKNYEEIPNGEDPGQARVPCTETDTPETQRSDAPPTVDGGRLVWTKITGVRVDKRSNPPDWVVISKKKDCEAKIKVIRIVDQQGRYHTIISIFDVRKENSIILTTNLKLEKGPTEKGVHWYARPAQVKKRPEE